MATFLVVLAWEQRSPPDVVRIVVDADMTGEAYELAEAFLWQQVDPEDFDVRPETLGTTRYLALRLDCTFEEAIHWFEAEDGRDGE